MASENGQTNNGGQGNNGAQQSNKKPQKRKLNKRVIICVVSVVLALCAIYFVGVVFFMGHTFPNTKINGEEASFVSIDEYAMQHNQRVNDYSASVHGDGISINFSGADVSLQFNREAYAKNISDVINEWAWILEIFQQRDYQVNAPLSYDQEKLEKIIGVPINAINGGAIQPQAATMSYAESSGQFIIVKEVGGTAINKDNAMQLVAESITSLQKDIEFTDKQLVQPALFADDSRLQAAVQKANLYLARKIELVYESNKIQTIDKSLIWDWITLNNNVEASVNENSLASWIKDDFGKKYNSAGGTRNYTRADGKQVSVSGGTYGFSINIDELTSSIKSAIENGTVSSIDVPMTQTAEKWAPGGADWTSYIDVDISEQHARYYNDSGTIVWESDFVSGLTKDNRDTPLGVYTINSNKSRDRTLIGSDANGDGKPDYETPVSYWIPFIEDSVAFHDANWRSTFGGDIYKSSGSHGCVNLPVDKAAQLYDLASVGLVVAVHN